MRAGPGGNHLRRGPAVQTRCGDTRADSGRRRGACNRGLGLWRFRRAVYQQGLTREDGTPHGRQGVRRHTPLPRQCNGMRQAGRQAGRQEAKLHMPQSSAPAALVKATCCGAPQPTNPKPLLYCRLAGMAAGARQTHQCVMMSTVEAGTHRAARARWSTRCTPRDPAGTRRSAPQPWRRPPAPQTARGRAGGRAGWGGGKRVGQRLKAASLGAWRARPRAVVETSHPG